MKKVILVSIVCIMLLTSCIQFLHPITDNKNQMSFRKELVGQWEEQDGTKYFIDSLDEKQYKVVVVDNRKEGNNFSDSNYFVMTLANINGELFLDCYPDFQQNSFQQLGEQVSNYILPLHYILKLNSIAGASIEIASINSKAVSKLIDQKKFFVQYDSTKNNNALLLLKSSEIQQKLIELEKFPAAWNKEILNRF